MSILEISKNNTVKDLWDNVIEDNFNFTIFNFRNELNYVFRLIGPLFKVERLLIPPAIQLSCFVKTYDLKKIAKGDEDIFRNVIINIHKEMNSEPFNENDFFEKFLNICDEFNDDECLTFLREVTNCRNNINQQKDIYKVLCSLFLKINWQKVLLSNAVILSHDSDSKHPWKMSENLELIVLNQTMCREICLNSGGTKEAISGLMAHNISINIENGYSKFDRKYNVKISKNSEMLSDRTIRFILKRGLIDSNCVIKNINQVTFRNMFGFLYRKNNYGCMSKDLLYDIYKELDQLVSNDEIDVLNNSLKNQKKLNANAIYNLDF